MTKTYCDCCGKDTAEPVGVDGKKFDLSTPRQIEFTGYRKKKLDLCYLCNLKIISFVREMQINPDKDWNNL